MMMNDSLKTVISAILLFLLFLAFPGCGQPEGQNDGGSNGDDEGLVRSYPESMMFLGDINKIYHSSSQARYITGQIIDGNRFEGNLVEYNSLKQSVLDYVESLPSNNALMHQNYESVAYDSSKKYVEFSTYTDVETKAVTAIELRIFFGNFMQTHATDYWYAKSVRFDADFTRNLANGESVNFTGEPDSDQ